MALRDRATGTPEPAPGAPDEPGLDELVTVLARLTARLIVHISRSHAQQGQGATFRAIVAHELHIANDAEIDIIEAWLTSHPGG